MNSRLKSWLEAIILVICILWLGSLLCYGSLFCYNANQFYQFYSSTYPIASIILFAILTAISFRIKSHDGAVATAIVALIISIAYAIFGTNNAREIALLAIFILLIDNFAIIERISLYNNQVEINPASAK